MTAREPAIEDLVSVIIPAYNRAAYIGEAIDSILAQTWPHYEILVVDDGSTDNTWAILKQYEAEGKIRLFSHPGHVNRGQAASINLGLRHMRGEYVLVLDSDDYVMPEKLEKQVAYLKAHPDVGLVYSNGYFVKADGEILWPYHAKDHQDPGDPNAVLLDCYMALPVNALVRRSVYDQVGEFEESFRAAQDHDMLIRMAEVTRFGYIPDFLFCYRRHGDSISAKRQDVRWRTGFEILERAARRYPYRSSTLRKRRAVLHYRMAQVSLSSKSYVSALLHLVKSGLLDPVRAAKVALRLERRA